ncbi:hypothetical protein MPTK1_1g28605 [Marchantia polymorpha subsp. ruderalis]|uniref:Uncharacterized protein n=1 Tax=Marchantia polymorpha subsp. ruderalis TaxID=1480154 RepID=A0A176VE40_MARPO|nr:hypothetical protein AXG93_4129s1110 [Marchantia polymorpha subsp. ruderalis]
MSPLGCADIPPFLLFEGSSSEQDKLQFFTYMGQRGVQLAIQPVLPVLRATVECSEWQAHAFSRLRSLLLLLRQRQLALSPHWTWWDRPVGTDLTALVRFGTYCVNETMFFHFGGQTSIAELENYVTGRSSSNFTRQLFLPHVHGSMGKLRIKLLEEGFVNMRLDTDTYKIKIFVRDIHYGGPDAYYVKVSSGLEFISLERGSSKAPFFRERCLEHRAVEQCRPNCVRYLIKRKEFITEGMLRKLLQQNPILEPDASAGMVGEYTMRVSKEYRHDVRFVRREREEKWASEDGLIVKLLDILEWKGANEIRDLTTIPPTSHTVRQEVEVHVRDADAQLLGSDMAAEKFITRFWNTGLRFKEFLL